MSRTLTLRLALVVAAALACGPSSSRHAGQVGPGVAELVPTPTAPGPVVGGPTQARIGAAGGAVAAPGGAVVVTVPPGAVAAPLDVRVTPIANLARGAAGPAFRLEPEGTAFLAPVTLTFRVPAGFPKGTSLADVGVATQDAAGYWHRVEPVTRDAAAGTVSVSTTHFSDWALTLVLDTVAAEGPITLEQGVVTPASAAPFTASGRATLFFLGDDESDTSYVLTGYLSVLDPASGTTTFTIDGATCVPDAATTTLPLSVAEVHKGATPVFRWGLGARWPLTCTDPGGPATPRELVAQFDTLSINFTHCGAGAYGAGQVVTSARIAGAYTIDVQAGEGCGAGVAGGRVRATWDLAACLDGLDCVPGDCRLGLTACAAGVQTCQDAGPAPDGTACGPASAFVCSAARCVDPADPAVGIRITPAAGLVTTEAGGVATFTIVLDAQPTTTVTIALSSSAPGEGTVSPASVAFGPAGWDVPLTVTVTGVDDLVMDGDQAYTVVTSAAVSRDPRYAGRDAPDVGLVNLDDDQAGLVVSTAGALVVSEAGGTATLTVALRSEPTALVTVAVTSADPGEVVAAPAVLYFTPSTWSAAQPVVLTGVPDHVVDGDQLTTVVVSVTGSDDPPYAALAPVEVPVTVTDVDRADVIVSPAGPLGTSTAAPTVTFTVVLTAIPGAEVVIPVSVSASDPSLGTVDVASVTFTPASWDQPQPVTVTGGAVAGSFTIVLGVATSADPLFAGLDPPDVTVVNAVP